MAPACASSFACLGASLILLDRRSVQLRAAAHVASLSAAVTPLLAILGYAFHARELHQLSSRTPFFALPAAMALFLLGVGSACARPDRGFLVLVTEGTAGSRVMRRLLPGAVIGPVLFGWLVLRSERSGLIGGRMATALFSLAATVSVVACLYVHAVTLRSSELLLREREERLRSIVESAVDGIVTIDDAGVVDTCNPAVERIFGGGSAGRPKAAAELKRTGAATQVDEDVGHAEEQQSRPGVAPRLSQSIPASRMESQVVYPPERFRARTPRWRSRRWAK